MRFAAVNWTKSLRKYLIDKTIVEYSFNHYRPQCRNFQCFSAQISEDSDRTISFASRSFGTSMVLSKIKSKGGKKKGKEQHIDMHDLAQFIDLENLTSKFNNSLEDLKSDFVKHLAIRSSAGSIERVDVTFDGQVYELQELVEIARKPKLVVLDATAFPQAIPQILDGIDKSGLNLNPQQDGTKIFIQIPKITKDHREKLSKNAKALYIKCRDSIKDTKNKEIQNLKKTASVSEDDCRRIEKQIQAVCDRYIADAEQLLDGKQKELLGEMD